MLNPVYDITEPIAADQWIRCRLVLELSNHYLQYAILQEKKLLCWKYYQLPAASPAEKLGMVEALFQTNDMLHNSMKEQLIVYNFTKNCLLPETLFHIDLNRPMLDMMQGDGYRGAVITEKIAGWNLYNVYRLPAGLDELCKARFANASFRHHVSLWLGCLDVQQDGIHLLFSEGEVEVTILHGNKLLLSQVFVYQEHADVLYHVLNLSIQLHLDREQMPVYIAGMLAPDAVIYHELLKYFGQVQTAALSGGFRVPESFQPVPDHFFSPLLKMLACV